MHKRHVTTVWQDPIPVMVMTYNLLSRSQHLMLLAEMILGAGPTPKMAKNMPSWGFNNGTVFIDISDPINPVYLGNYPHILLQQLGEMLRFITTMPL